MIRWLGAALVVAGISLTSTPASAAGCVLTPYLQLPVTMSGRRATIIATINGHEARFLVDSGSFFSLLSKAATLEYGLSLQDIGNGNVRLAGIGGNTSLGMTVVKSFGIAGQTITNLEFGVGGSDTGFAGTIGQNILAVADTEYDLPHSMVRVLKSQNCANAVVPYWAPTKPASFLRIEPIEQGQRHTVATVALNGVKIKAMFDTGATGSLLTLAAAKRAGITPDSPGVTPGNFALGFGTKRVRTWRAHFDSIDIGGEKIPTPTLTIVDDELHDVDMLIGIDFFLSHRVYVDNNDHHMILTYEGGPVLGLAPERAVDDKGVALDLTDKAGEPTDAAGYSRRAGVLASGGKYPDAIADLDKAVAMAPSDPQYLVQRGLAHLSNRQPLLGSNDLDKAIQLAPTDPDARLARAQLRSNSRDPAGALADLKAADAALAPSAEPRLRLAAGFTATGNYDGAIASIDLWLKSHTEDHGRASALNSRCWARALANRELDKALSDCEAALHLFAGQAEFLDSRATVWFRRGEFDKAIADYTAVIDQQPRNGWARYARSLAERAAGKTGEADKDRAAALAINPQLPARAKGYGMEQ